MRLPFQVLGSLTSLTDLGLIKEAGTIPFSGESLKILENIAKGSSSSSGFNLNKLVELVKLHPVLAISIIAGSLLALRALKSKDTENHPYFLIKMPGK